MGLDRDELAARFAVALATPGDSNVPYSEWNHGEIVRVGFMFADAFLAALAPPAPFAPPAPVESATLDDWQGAIKAQLKADGWGDGYCSAFASCVADRISKARAAIDASKEA